MVQTQIDNKKIFDENLKVGIIVPVYNVENFIHKCVNSIIGQVYKNWELILVDDGSPDNSGKICDQFASQDDRIKVVHKINGGLVSAWKKGIEEMPDYIEYITFVDSDDWLTNNFLKCMVDKQQENKADIVVTRLCGIYPNNKIELDTFPIKVKFYNRVEMEKELFPVLLYGGDFHKRGLPCSRCGKLIKKELMVKNLKFISERTTYGEDLNITFPMFLDANSIDVIQNDECLYMVRKNPDSMTRSYDKNMLFSINYVYKSLQDIVNTKKLSNLFEKQILADYLAASVQYYKNELQNSNSFNTGLKNIEKYVDDNEKLKKAINEINWKHYRKLNVIIITCLRNFNWFNRNVITATLYVLKKYRVYILKKLNTKV